MAAWLSQVCPRLLAAWTSEVQRRRWIVLIAVVVLTAAAVVAVSRDLAISTDTVDMISAEVPFRQHAEEFNATFPQLKNTILAVVDAPTPEQADDLTKSFAQSAQAADSIREVYLPGGDFLRNNAFLYLDPDELALLVDRLAQAEPMLATLADSPNMDGLAELLELAVEHGADDTLGGLDTLLAEMAVTAEAKAEAQPRNLSWQSLLVEEDAERLPGTRRFVVLSPEMDFARLRPAAAAIADVQEAIVELESAMEAEGGRIRLTGEAFIAHQELESIETGGIVAALLSLVAVSVILLAGLRAPRLVAASIITLVLGLVWTAGLAAVVVGELNLISVAFAVLFLGLGIDFCIHFILRYREERRAGTGAAITATGHGVGCALLLSALCAAVGFLSFLPTAYRGLAELGVIAGIGMFVAVGASLTVLPALIAVWQPRRGFPEPSRLVSEEQRFVANHGRKVLVIALLVGVSAAAIAPRISFDFNPMNLRDPNTSSIRTFVDLASDPQITPYTVNVVAADLEHAEAVAQRFRDDGDFGSVTTLASFVPENQDVKLDILEDATFFLAPILMASPGQMAETAADLPDAYFRLGAALSALSEGTDAVAAEAQRLRDTLVMFGDDLDLQALERRWTAHLPDMLDYLRTALSAEAIAFDDLPSDLRERWMAEDGRSRVEVRPPVALTTNEELRYFARKAKNVSESATGAPIVIHEASKAVVAAFQQATIYAFIAIVALLALALGRVGDVLLALAPLAFAAMLTLAAAVIFGIPLNFANVIVLPLLLGLGVSSGIHLVLRARQVAVIDQVFATSTPRAVLLSVLTTLASFGTLTISPHRGMSSMGALLTIAVAFTLISVLLVLPCLIAEIARRRDARKWY